LFVRFQAGTARINTLAMKALTTGCPDSIDDIRQHLYNLLRRGGDVVPIGRFVLTFFTLSIIAGAQEDPLAWFPLQVGSRSVYEHESKSGDRNRPEVVRWTTEETITGRVTIPEGLVVLREVKQQSNASDQAVTSRPILPNGQLREVRQQISDSGYYVTRDGEPYLVHGNCIYVIGEGWDSQRQQLRPQYRNDLADGSLSPDFCFPFQRGSAWGNNDTPWRVEPAQAGLGSFLPAKYAEAIHIVSRHFGSGGQEDVWFQKGLGVVGAHYIHNGTYDEYTKTLLTLAP
jgi:hypothetical protein